MTSRADIIDGASAAGREYGLIYTRKCGWVDLGHASPVGANALWQKILTEHDIGDAKPGYFRISYQQNMSVTRLKMKLQVGETRKYDVKKGLNIEEKKSVALSIFLNVSHAFESMQSGWLFRLATNSGYSAEDLFSNLLGFYRAVHPNKQYIFLCEPASKSEALTIWDTFGAVGDNKNYSTTPFIYPTPPSLAGPMCAQLPVELTTIKPAEEGVLFSKAVERRGSIRW